MQMLTRRGGRPSGVVAPVVIALSCVLTGLFMPQAGAASGDIGTLDQSFSGVTNPPTSDKPQSKLWFNDGLWWATMFEPVSSTWHIYRLNRPSEQWVDTGTQVDNRPQTLSDALWDGQKLYIGSQWVTISTTEAPKASVSAKPARLYRYSYSSATKTYSLDTGFPKSINNNSSESLTIDKDTTGRIWATWTQVSGSNQNGFTNAVYVNSSATGEVWGTPMVLPVTGANPGPDDISGLVAFKSKIGVLWSNHLDDTVYWAVHKDGDPLTTWNGSVAVHGSKQPDDHMNLKTIQSDVAGRVFAAVKTSLDELAGAPSSSPQINLLVFKPGTGSWSSTTFGTVADCHTRPIVVLDEENSEVHVFATAPSSGGCPGSGTPGTIYEKVAPLSNPVFASGRGTPVIRDAASAQMNNPTSTKQSVTHATGLVVLAGNTSTNRYWHADLPIAGAAQAPTASFTSSVSSGIAPLSVSFTDTSTQSPTSWAWDFGDGSSSTLQNPWVTYANPGTYTVSLTATNATGSSALATGTITVTPAPQAPTASFTSSVSSGTAPLSVSFTDTSTQSPTSWAWDFGDGSTSTLQNPSVTYAAAGSYTVTLTATNAVGTSAPATATITVNPAPSGIVRQSTSTAVTTVPATGLTVAKPAGTAPGDVLVSCLTLNGSAIATNGAPTGWTRFAAATGVSNPHVYGYYKVAGAAEPDTYTWGYSTSIVSSGGIARYSGAAGLDGLASTAAGASATTGTVPGVTTTTSNTMLVGCMGINSGAPTVTITAPTGMSELWDLAGKRQETDDALQALVGETASRTWTFSTGREWAGWLVVLRPV